MILKTTFQILLFLNLFLSVTTVLGQETKLIVEKFEGSKQISRQYSVLKSNNLIKHGEYISYFRITENDRLHSKNVSIENFIKIKTKYKNGKLDGEWIEYDQPLAIKSKGQYINDKKVGVWETTKEAGQVIVKYDFDKKAYLKPVISVSPSYPAVARENGIAYNGKVIASYKIHADCSVTDIVIVKNLSKECDDEVIKLLTKLSLLQIKYCDSCEEKEYTKEFIFKLE